MPFFSIVVGAHGRDRFPFGIILSPARTVPSCSHGPDMLADLKIGMLIPPLKR